MEIRQLELFVIAAEEGHFSRAAKRANIVQSGLSSAIQTLEEELGARLFVRNTRRVELSEAGRIFLPEARRVLQSLKTAREAVAAMKGALVGRLAIGSVQSLSSFFDLPKALNAFHERYPRVEIIVRETYVDSVAQSLREGSLDLAFVPTSGLSLAGLEVEIAFEDEMVAVLPPNHRLAGRDRIGLSELSGEKFIDFSHNWGTRRLVDQILRHEGLERQSTFEVENLELLLQFVERGFGIAIAPRKMTTNRELRILSIVSSTTSRVLPAWELGLLRRKQPGTLAANPPAELFRKLVEEQVRGNSVQPRV